MAFPSEATTSAIEPRPPSAPSRDRILNAGRQPLNAMDGVMQAVNAALQSMHSAGFETQALLWLRGRVDVDALRQALDLLGEEYPVIASRLVAGARRTPYWRFRPDANCPLHETWLESADLKHVLDHAARLLSRPHDLSETDPVSFHLLHLPDGRDVVLVQYNHVLMDNGAAVPLLRELDRLAESRENRSVGREDGDVLAGYLKRYSWKRRWRAVWRSARFRLASLGSESAQLPGSPPLHKQSGAATVPLPVRILSQTLEPRETLALEEWVGRVCRFAGLSMAILSSVFRAMHAVGLGRRGDARLIAGIGLDLGLRDALAPAFQNLASVVPIFAESGGLEDRDELLRLLNGQLRDRLAEEFDLGIVQFATTFRRCRRLVRSYTHRLLRDGYSLWYACFADLDAIGPTFCGAEVDDFFHIGPCWSSTGFTLIASRFQDRLHLQATFLPDVVSEETVERLLRFVADDLRE